MIPSPTRQTNPVDILVADPDRDSRDLYRDSLVTVDEHLVEAVDGREALVKALIKPPALVITELQLPHIDGVSLCEILRQDRTTSRVPIIVITSITDRKQIDRAYKAGADTVLLKPTPFATIRLAMRRLIAEAEALRERSARVQAKSAAESERAVANLARAAAVTPKLSKAHQRFTTITPPIPPPVLTCPFCDGSLRYEYSHVGGVSALHSEQWDYYVCSRCGPFQYRQRSRKLRRVS